MAAISAAPSTEDLPTIEQSENAFVSALLNDPRMLIYQESGDGIRRILPDEVASLPIAPDLGPPVGSGSEDLSAAIKVRRDVSEGANEPNLLPEALDGVAKDILILPRSERWREAVSTALLGDWISPLFRTGHLPTAALSTLRAEARLLHRQLVPVWRRRTRHGRVLSLDAELGEGLSLHDLIAAHIDVDLLTLTASGVFDDERLNALLRGMSRAEQRVVFAYAAGAGSTWAEAAAAAGAADPEAFGERVRRKAKRLAAEQQRRLTQRQTRLANP
ncbi:hypothetical protein [Streptomyces sp. NPDC054834]